MKITSTQQKKHKTRQKKRVKQEKTSTTNRIKHNRIKQKQHQNNKNKTRSEFLEFRSNIDQIDMTHNLLTAAVPIKTKIIQDLLLILTLIDTNLEVLPKVGYRLTTTPATNRNYHFFTKYT
jgi:signal recognition particle GTPase